MSFDRNIDSRERNSCPAAFLGEKLTEEIYLKAVRHASYEAKKYKWRNGSQVFIPKGTPEDIVIEAIEKILSGVRRWDPVRKDLLSYLKETVESLLSHAACSFENRKIISSSDTFGVQKGSASTVETPEDHYLAKELYWRLYVSIDGNERAERILACLITGTSKPLWIADETGLDIRAVYKAKERLRETTRRLVEE